MGPKAKGAVHWISPQSVDFITNVPDGVAPIMAWNLRCPSAFVEISPMLWRTRAGEGVGEGSGCRLGHAPR